MEFELVADDIQFSAADIHKLASAWPRLERAKLDAPVNNNTGFSVLSLVSFANLCPRMHTLHIRMLGY